MKVIVGAGSLNQTPLDWEGNFRRIVSVIHEARAKGMQLLCLPELCIPGYGCEDAFLSPGCQTRSLNLLTRLLPETSGIVVSVGLPFAFEGKLYNVAALIADRKLLGFVAKHTLAGSGVYYEPRWFSSWPLGKHGFVKVGNSDIPFGDLIFDFNGTTVGFEICEDAWATPRRACSLSRHGTSVVLNPSASHFAFGKLAIREQLVRAGSSLVKGAYVYANHLGNDSGRLIYDGGSLIGFDGEIVAQGRRFSYADVVLTEAAVELVQHPPLFRDDTSPFCVRGAWQFSPTDAVTQTPLIREGWERSDSLKEQEFLRAVALGLFDYLRKSRSQGFVISLSGGADSSALSCLVSLMAQLAVSELTLKGVLERLSYWPDVQGVHGVRELQEKLLTCVYQATENSSETTRGAAEQVARASGARFYALNVQPLVNAYLELMTEGEESVTGGRKLSWKEDDLALQNLQARVRGPGVWLIANLRGALLLTTSNRSEASVGYTTMDGDTCGGLAPLGGIDKAFLRRWLRWLETTAGDGIAPIPELRSVNVQAPTAELRPPSARQTDESDLMPYEVLDPMERWAIRDRLPPTEVLEKLAEKFPSIARQELVSWVARFFRLWARSQWKRERYAPAFHLDDESVDPKTWCRFPILSGGFETEIVEMLKLEESK